MAIECAGRAIVIDCGVMFPDEPALGLGTISPRWRGSSAVTSRSRRWCSRTRTRITSARCRICCAASTFPFTAPTSRSRSRGGASPMRSSTSASICGRSSRAIRSRRGRSRSSRFASRIRRPTRSRSRFARPRASSFTAAISRSTTRRWTASCSIANALPSLAPRASRCCSRIRPTSSARDARARKVRSSRSCASSRRARAAGFSCRHFRRICIGFARWSKSRASSAAASFRSDARWRRACGWVSRPASFRLRKRCSSSRARPSLSTAVG